MKPSKMFAVALAFTCTLAAQERGNWRAVSSNARAITSDISLSAEKIQIDFIAFPISWIRPLQPAELKAAFVFDGDAAGTGSLYKLNIPATQKFLKKNSLCGADDTQWMVTYLAGREL